MERVNNQLGEHFDGVVSPLIKSIHETLDLNPKQINLVKSELDEFIRQSDKNLAEQMVYIDRLKGVEAHCEQIVVDVDRIDQYNRQYILNFLRILNRGTKACPERPYDVIIEFLRRHLGIFISKRDISICHRQDIPSERRKLGKNYIAPIYCKFVNRSVVHAILEKRHLLKNIRNEANQPYLIKSNLTPTRRLLLKRNSDISDSSG